MSNIGVQSLPLGFFKEYCTGNIGGFTTQLGKMKNSPRHNHINSKAGFNAVSMPQLPFLDLATTLKCSMINFDSPTQSIPGQLLGRFLKVCDRASGQKHPFDGFHTLRGIHFLGQNGPNAQASKLRLPYRRLEGNLSKTYFKPCNSGWTFPSTRHMDLLNARYPLLFHFLPQITLFLGKDPILACPHQKLGTSGVLQGQFKELVNICFTITHANESGSWTPLLCFNDLTKTYQPLMAFFLFNGHFVPTFLFPKILSISRPTLDIQQSQRSTIPVKCHRVMKDQSNPSVQTIPNGAKILRGRMSCVVQSGGILRSQYHLFFARTLQRRFIMLFKNLIHAHMRMFKKTISRLCFRSALTCLWNACLRTCIKVTYKADKPIRQSFVSQISCTKFLLSPILDLLSPFWLRLYHTAHRLTTQHLSGIFSKRKDIDIFNWHGIHPLSILPASATGATHILPVCCPVTTTMKSIPLYKGFQQHRFKTVTFKPIPRQSFSTQRQNMRGQIGHLNLGQNQKTAITNHLPQMPFSGSIAPANPVIPSFNSPGRPTEGQSTQPSTARTFDQIPDLSPTQRTTTQVMISVHQDIPQTRCLTFTASYPYQLNPAQFPQIAANRVNLLNGPLALWAGLKRWFGSTLGQIDNPLSMQFQQGHTATHFFKSAIGACPIQPLANSKGKCSPRNRGLRFNRFIYFTDHLVRKMLTANQHENILTHWHPLCPAKTYGTWTV